MPRQNEYFVPRDNIDREVISADICRYLGNDALVRPGFYENPQTGQVVEGYYITAYRNLTTAMIDDLKADSARWESERRAQSSRASASLSTHALIDASGTTMRPLPNSQTAQYHLSDIHMARQNRGPSEYYTDNSSAREPSGSAPRYPGTGAPGYTGATPSSYPNQPTYATTGGSGYSYPPNQQSPQLTAPRNPPHPQPGSGMNPGYPTGQDHPYIATGANNNQRFDPYARGTVAPALQPEYGTPASSQPGYSTHMNYTNVSPGVHSGMQPPEGYYGRASPAGPNQPMGAPGYTPQPQPTQPYDENPVTRASAPPATKAQTPPGSSGRRSDRDTDRHASDRHHRSSRR